MTHHKPREAGAKEPTVPVFNLHWLTPVEGFLGPGAQAWPHARHPAVPPVGNPHPACSPRPHTELPCWLHPSCPH